MSRTHYNLSALLVAVVEPIVIGYTAIDNNA